MLAMCERTGRISWSYSGHQGLYGHDGSTVCLLLFRALRSTDADPGRPGRNRAVVAFGGKPRLRAVAMPARVHSSDERTTR